MNLGFTEMLFIFLVALIIFGPRKLPEIGRQVGKALAEFKRASNGFKSQLELEMRQIEIEEAIRKEKEALVQTIQSPTGTVGSTGLARAADNTPSEGQDSPYPPVDVSAAPQQSPYPPNDVTNSDAVKRDNA